MKVNEGRKRIKGMQNSEKEEYLKIRSLEVTKYKKLNEMVYGDET
jgi:hypothetical protein